MTPGGELYYCQSCDRVEIDDAVLALWDAQCRGEVFFAAVRAAIDMGLVVTLQGRKGEA